ncbi:hypothetical protein MATL_G00083310 [Megalops atlanticus]|uniref:V-SNARE coiled-coil homology domain-containing protein n=1 Tax=Megalops atlanticus TaxID=7932 RepID=A0A9D3Q456_MEGAT|nr:hypothetical protein MATL_G00083310 [Megalops atlanticus]
MSGDDRLEQLQKDVDEVKVIMKDNLEKVDERGEHLQDLDKRSELLRQQSMKFSKTAVKVKQKKRSDNNRMKILLVGVLVGLVLLVIIIAVLATSYKTDDSNAQQSVKTDGP